MKIWKQDFPATEGMYVAEFTQGAILLSAREQRGRVTVWALCNHDAPAENYKILVAETGYSVHSAHKFLGTAMFDSGAYVLHVFSVDD